MALVASTPFSPVPRLIAGPPSFDSIVRLSKLTLFALSFARTDSRSAGFAGSAANMEEPRNRMRQGAKKQQGIGDRMIDLVVNGRQGALFYS